QRLRVPADCRELADVVAREHGHIHASGTLGAAALLRLLERCDALRRPARFAHVLQACECDARGRAGLQDRPYAPAARLPGLLQAALAVDTAALAAAATAQGRSGPAIGSAIHAARVQAIEAALPRPA
ncbi:MAG: multifunctional CCA tRNA nucleotidyl transferase/2'3'-cyclic phosphodiesterase/2'nucleotidase/phosphatase, partial [Rubrivivax sp.]|nr:multifunctional CCA tRNA nucleotidyl transferase/2'3'-cyclic phosphodiesterase/2'nucleotidase/phosphatase [Rubrivivax sp.]